MYYFITVNYNSSHLVKDWITSIKKTCKNKHEIIIIDNFSTLKEKIIMQKLAKKYNFILIESSNIGYGAAINKGINYIKNYENDKNKINNNIVIFAGNMDLIYKNIPEKLSIGNFVYVPQVYENNRNRNPFLTRLQKNLSINFYKLAAVTNSVFFYYIAIGINKLIGFIPSKIWAVHGSLFCFNYKLINKYEKIFNDNSFLYAEELEFASYMEYKNAIFINTDIIVEHKSHATTQYINKSRKDFLKLWIPSFNNWLNRWIINKRRK